MKCKSRAYYVIMWLCITLFIFFCYVIIQRGKDSWLHSLKRSFNGFVAKLSQEEKNEIASLDGVISVFPSTKKKLHTTRSWDFMGFPMNVPRTTTESDLIIGMLYTGIWPESIVNTSPWSLSVAANTIDRTFLANVQLGNNRIYEGVAINTFELKNDGYPLVYGGNVPNTADGFDGSVSRYYELGSLDPKLVKGAIVFCDWGTDAEGTAPAGETGTIMQGVGNDISSPSGLYIGTRSRCPSL
ncbi:hypothetical protein ABFX02_06G071400 [Erythranthe guttata]